MCGRFTQTLKRDDLVSIFPRAGSLTDDPRVYERFNVAPTDPVLAVISRDGEQRLGPLRWGLIPFWAKDVRIGAKMINARAETLTEKPAFRDLVKQSRSRCLIVADGYYEWLRPEDPKGQKIPMHMALADGGPFAFAGLWTWWRDKAAGDEAERIASCTIITTAANATVRPVHDRMPAILADDASRAAWLDPAGDDGAALELLRPLPDEALTVAPANPLVNSVANQGPQLLVSPDG
jgi:putative SOS response-associated peptidase YedK